MKRTQKSGDREWPIFPIGPILEHYGIDAVEEDRGWHACLCPFHGDRSKSASVNTVLHVFVCHGCDMKGNAVQLIMKQENKAYADALKIAETISGKSNASVHGELGAGRGVSSRTRNRSGSRAFKRTRRSG